MELKTILEYEILHINNFILTPGTLLSVIITLAITFFVLRIIKNLLFKRRIFSSLNRGNLMSIYQIVQYLVWILSILLILETFGIKLNAILAGSAALLVGLGLGLQNTFNNFIAGFILLFEGIIKVGDILEIDGDVVKLQKIGFRTSEAIDRDDIVVILPNSLITSNKVINWSHQSHKTRFRINVGVAYGSDVDMVLTILKESAMDHPDITSPQSVHARFINFGNSSLDFELLFFSENIFRIENLKSDIRININRKFAEHNITIPFPQMDVHLKK